jgi:hypothetical protein
VTPEGKIKAKVKRILDQFKCYYFMPVQMGYGAAGLDFHCLLPILALAFFIETKAPGRMLTPRQDNLVNHLRNLGVKVFVIWDDVTLAELKEWLDEYSLTPSAG